MRARAVLVVVCLAAACVPPPPPVRHPNVLLIVVDTLRADRLATYGGTRGLTPFLDEFAAAHHVIREARVQAPWTNPSVASILTSRWQSQHRIVDFGSVLAESEVTLAEALRAAGYATGAFTANGLIAASLGFGQGFDTYQAHLFGVGDDPVVVLRIPVRMSVLAEQALAWLDGLRAGPQRDAPVFLYLQPVEPHAPYDAPPEVVARLRGARPPMALRDASELMFGGPLEPIDDDALQGIVDAYDASVASLDGALRTFFAALEARGFLDDAIVVVTADHGEEFQEHGLRGHGKTLYDEVLRVPLLVATPGGASSGTVDTLVSSIDVAPTILDLAGVARPASFEGTSFAPALAAGLRARLRRLVARLTGAGTGAVTYSEHLRPDGEAPNPRLPHLRAVADGGAKLIWFRDGRREVYDMDLDPGEQDPELAEEADRVRLERRLDVVRGRAERAPSPAEQRPLDARTREALDALGYVE